MIQRLRGLPERAALGAVLGLLVAILWMVAGSAPRGTDGLIYHLTIPAKWLQSGWLSPVELPFHDGAAEHAPVLVETAWWALMKRTGDARPSQDARDLFGLDHVRNQQPGPGRGLADQRLERGG